MIIAFDELIIQKETNTVSQSQLTNAIAALTSRQREAIFLRFYKGIPYGQVAETLSITVKVTYKIVAHALDELHQFLNVSGIVVLFLLSKACSKKFLEKFQNC